MLVMAKKKIMKKINVAIAGFGVVGKKDMKF